MFLCVLFSSILILFFRSRAFGWGVGAIFSCVGFSFRVCEMLWRVFACVFWLCGLLD